MKRERDENNLMHAKRQQEKQKYSTYKISILVMIPVMHFVLSPSRNRLLHHLKRRFSHCPVDILVFGRDAERFAYAREERLVGV